MKGSESFGLFLALSILVLGVLGVFSGPLSDENGGFGIRFAFGQASSTVSVTSTVTISNANPTVSAVTLNNGSAITLTPNTTTSISVNATISDNNGCSDVNNGGATTSIAIIRSGFTSSTCRLGTTNSTSCYLATAFTASSTCSSGTTNTTTTFAVQYFANATDASSSFSAQNWIATVIFKDPNNGTGSADSSGVELNTLLAINVTTSSIAYGTLAASSTFPSTSTEANPITTSTNAGNSSSSLSLRITQTLVAGSNSLASDTTQLFSTSTFVVVGTSTFITTTTKSVAGFTLTAPTSTTNVSKEVYWGITVPAGTATGTYSGFNLFTAVFQP